jgi:hypothetical protein
MKINPRTVLAVALFIPLAAVLLVTSACLPVPVGNPETSKVDETLSGIYQLQNQNPADKDTALAILKPWDAKTYILDYVTTETKDNNENRQIQHFKCWLTTIAGKTFITCQPMDGIKPLLNVPDTEKPVWLVLRLNKVPSGLEILMVNPDSDFLKNLTKQEEFEAAIKAHAEDKGLYGEPATFKKLGKDDQALVEETLAKFNVKPVTK